VSAPRIAPGGRGEVALPIRAFARIAGRVTGTTPPNLFLTLGRHRRLFWGWLRFAGRLMPGGRLPRRESELVILRVAHLRDCAYEFEHHVRLGRRAGVTEEDVRRVVAGPSAGGWSDREQAILTAVDELHHRGDVTDPTWATLRRHLDETRLIELCMLVGHYEMLATTLITLRVQPDARRARRPSRSSRARAAG
jgi:AhpD family alkylhydroperoxidase